MVRGYAEKCELCNFLHNNNKNSNHEKKKLPIMCEFRYLWEIIIQQLLFFFFLVLGVIANDVEIL